MGIIAWILLGLIAGALAKALMPGRDPGGIVATIMIEIAGALIGGFIWNLLSGAEGYCNLDVGGILIAVLGAMLLLWAYRRMAVNRMQTTRAERLTRSREPVTPRRSPRHI